MVFMAIVASLLAPAFRTRATTGVVASNLFLTLTNSHVDVPVATLARNVNINVQMHVLHLPVRMGGLAKVLLVPNTHALVLVAIMAKSASISIRALLILVLMLALAIAPEASTTNANAQEVGCRH